MLSLGSVTIPTRGAFLYFCPLIIIGLFDSKSRMNLCSNLLSDPSILLYDTWVCLDRLSTWNCHVSCLLVDILIFESYFCQFYQGKLTTQYLPSYWFTILSLPQQLGLQVSRTVESIVLAFIALFVLDSLPSQYLDIQS